jgi:hypothetical protein
MQETMRREQGLKAWWQFRKERKRLNSVLKRVKKLLQEKKLLNQLSASHYTRKIWTRILAQCIEPITLCRYLGGEISFKEMLKRLQRGHEFSPSEVKELNNTARMVQDEIKDNDNTEFVRFLSVLA